MMAGAIQASRAHGWKVKERHLFVNKKKQNTLLIWAVPVSLPQAQSDKIFAPLFKKRLLS
jgi:hypothetical protein